MEDLVMFGSAYKGKTVLVTGHTGFKGAWLTSWLLSLGAKVVGVSKDIPSSPSMYDLLGLKDQIIDIRLDIKDLTPLTECIHLHRPDFLFHLAAQPIVSESYRNPIETIATNALGTAHLLEALRTLNSRCTAIFVTSDKAYDNIEQIWGYRETDRLGGKDIYSASKGAAEIVIRAYYESFFKRNESKIRIAVGRAGNVIGGGDWSKDRIIVDAINAWVDLKPVDIRSPKATRPWQHVLEPLSGYLQLGSLLLDTDALHGEAFNFGPSDKNSYTVECLLFDMARQWKLDHSPFNDCSMNATIKEANLLKLDCDKAMNVLAWEAALSYSQMVQFTTEWYKSVCIESRNPLDTTLGQISSYCSIASSRGISWTA